MMTFAELFKIHWFSTTALASTSRAACSTDCPSPKNLNGSDFGPNYLRRTKHRYRLFLLGAQPGTAERAARRLTALCPQHNIVGCHHGHFDAGEVAEITDLIRRSGANVLLVAMGNPKQELFIHNHLAATGCLLGIGVGALFDFLAGDVPRAPPWVQRWRFEWVYRLALEPRRLAGRYLVGNPLFLMRILRQWWSSSRLPHAGLKLRQQRCRWPEPAAQEEPSA